MNENAIRDNRNRSSNKVTKVYARVRPKKRSADKCQNSKANAMSIVSLRRPTRIHCSQRFKHVNKAFNFTAPR